MWRKREGWFHDRSPAVILSPARNDGPRPPPSRPDSDLYSSPPVHTPNSLRRWCPAPSMNPSSPPSRDTIEKLVGQPVRDLSLYRRALTHRSVLRTRSQQSLRSNERLEFLGDAFLDLVISDALYERFPEKNEGELTRLRARLVSEGPLARFARRLDLGPHLQLSKNAERDNARENASILADAFEAIVGAVYLDLGHEAAREFVRTHAVAPFDLSKVAARDENYKSQLLERMQAVGRPQPTYHVVSEKGPSHDKTFTVEVRVGESAYERGTAGNKQEAEQRAARDTLARLADAESAP